MFGLILLLLIGCLLFYAVRTHNSLRSRSEKVKRAYSDLLGEMRKHATLANQLIDICKDYGNTRSSPTLPSPPIFRS
jgi:LemA protein